MSIQIRQDDKRFIGFEGYRQKKIRTPFVSRA